MNIAVIVAAGHGTRMNNEMPKQFIKLNGTPLLIYSLKTFSNHKDIDRIYLVLAKEYNELGKKLIDEYKIEKVESIVTGGDSREESVFNAVEEIINKYDDNDNVLIHDGARMFISEKTISDNINSLKTNSAVATVNQVSDTLIEIDNGYNKLNRDKIKAMQTPQSFKLSLLKQMDEYTKNNKSKYTDEISILIDMKKNFALVEGNKNNFKITFDEDLKYAEYLLNQQK